MKKIVVVFGALSTLLFLSHFVVACMYYMGIMPYGYIHIIIGGVLSITMSIHMVAVMSIMGKNRQKDKKAKQYPQLNKSLVLQTATGMCTFIFLIVHILVIELSQSIDGTIINIIYISAEFLFVLTVCAHIAVSVPKHLISIGFIKKRENYPLVIRGTHLFIALILVIYVAAQIMFWTA